MYGSHIGTFLTVLSFGAVVLLQGCGQPDGLSGSSAHINSPAYPAHREMAVHITPTYDEKAAMLATIETWQTAKTTPQPTGAVKATPNPVTPIPRVAGQRAGAGTIVERPHTAVLRAYAIDNMWYTETTTETISVFAGAFTEDQEQGVVLITYRSLTELKSTRKGVYRTTPKKVGALHITGADGMRLFLEAKDGTPFTFDVEKAAFEP